MVQTNNLTTANIHPISLAKRMLISAGLGFILISMFLLSAGEGDPAWGNLWRIKPLIMVPLAGAGAGLINFLMDELCSQGGWKKSLTMIFTIIVYIIALWLGFVLGLNGTHWS